MMRERTLAKIEELAREARELQRVGRYAEAVVPLQSVIDLSTTAFGSTHLETLRGEMNLAVNHRRHGDGELALSMLSDVVSALGARVGDREAAYVYRMALNNFAATFRWVGRLEEARAAFEDCLEITETEINALLEEQARVFDNLADVLTQQGELEKAEDLARRGHEAWRKLRGEDSLELAPSMTHLGTICMRRGNLIEARPLLEKALRLEEALAGADHPNVGAALNLVATLEMQSGNLDLAAECFTRSLAIAEKSLLPTHSQATEAKEGLEQIDRMRIGSG